MPEHGEPSPLRIVHPLIVFLRVNCLPLGAMMMQSSAT